MNITYNIIKTISPFIPEKLRTILRNHFNFSDYDLTQRKALNPYINLTEKTYSDGPVFGIIEDVTQQHKHYIAACREMKVSYKVFNLLDNDWISNFQNSNCQTILVWPTNFSTVHKQLFDYRLRILEQDLGMRIFPTWKECWLSEYKPRLRDWMIAHNIPHPTTWVFYEREDALNFVDKSSFPILVKTATGASGSGVQLVQTKSDLNKIIRIAFGKGLNPRGFDPRDRQRGFIFIQKYLANVEEWRMVRIGDSYFGYRKEKGRSGLHSASHSWSWLDPGKDLLNMLKKITDEAGFYSMNIDIFKTTDGQLLVNECQTVFGCSTPVIQMKVNDIEGRYLWSDNEWKFDPGNFSNNHMCNLRLDYLLKSSISKPEK